MRNKIYLDISESPYKINYKGLIFVFSSIANLKKFENKIENYIKQETFKIKSMYSYIEINFDLFLTIAFYKRIEKRGFLVYDNDISLSNDMLFLASYVAKGKHF